MKPGFQGCYIHELLTIQSKLSTKNIKLATTLKEKQQKVVKR